MSVILAIEKTGAYGKKFYHLKDCETHLERKWIPPKGLSTEARMEGLETIARTMANYAETLSKYTPRSTGEAFVPTKDMLLKDFVQEVFLPRKIVTLAENTRDRWVNTFKTHVLPALGFYRMNEITALVITDYLLDLQRIGLAYATVNRHYTMLQSIFKMAYMMDIMEESPMKKVERPKRRKNEYVDDTAPAYTPQEVVRIMECIENEPVKYQAMIMIMCETGMRRGECCGLTWDNIDFQNGTINIVSSLYYTPEKGIYLDTPKNRKKHTVYISEKTVNLLQVLSVWNLMTTNSKFVFTQRQSADPIHPHTPTRYFADFGKKYGIDHMHPHKLRHTFASIAITNGADAVSVAKLLGHANTEVLFRYYTSASEQNAKNASMTYQNAITRTLSQQTSESA